MDQGAIQAITEEGKSLLPVGVRAVEGEFEPGDVVAMADKNGKEYARGLVNYSSSDTRRIMGHPSTQIEALLGYITESELIHRDNLVVLVNTSSTA